jgi:hypothetical protein
MDYAIGIISDLTTIHPELKNKLLDLIALGYREGMVDAYGGVDADEESIQYALFATEEFFKEAEDELKNHSSNDTLHNRIKNWY